MVTSYYFDRRPLRVRAMQYMGDNAHAVYAWAAQPYVRIEDDRLTVNGRLVADGDMVLKHPNGLVERMMPDDFAVMYERPVESRERLKLLCYRVGCGAFIVGFALAKLLGYLGVLS